MTGSLCPPAPPPRMRDAVLDLGCLPRRCVVVEEDLREWGRQAGRQAGRGRERGRGRGRGRERDIERDKEREMERVSSSKEGSNSKRCWGHNKLERQQSSRHVPPVWAAAPLWNSLEADFCKLSCISQYKLLEEGGWLKYTWILRINVILCQLTILAW